VSFTLTGVVVPLQPQGLAFTDARHGLISFARCAVGVSCPAGRIEATSDGGRTWRFVARRTLPATPPGPNPPCRTDASFAARAGAIALALCGSVPGAGEQEKLLYRSTDGGRTWRLTGDSGCGRPPKGVAMINCLGYLWGLALSPDARLAIVLEDRGTMWISHDAGVRWTALPSVSRPELDWPVGASALPDGRAFVLLASGGRCPCRLIATTDAGRSWRVVHRWS
jgi:photosystem II stability/assembly factor-like uncharacterized protein